MYLINRIGSSHCVVWKRSLSYQSPFYYPKARQFHKIVSYANEDETITDVLKSAHLHSGLEQTMVEGCRRAAAIFMLWCLVKTEFAIAWVAYIWRKHMKR